MQSIKTYFAECMSTGTRHKISEEIFMDLERHRFETIEEVSLKLYKDGHAEIEDASIVKVPVVHLYDRNHNEYELKA